jgi:hypothetical protein
LRFLLLDITSRERLTFTEVRGSPGRLIDAIGSYFLDALLLLPLLLFFLLLLLQLIIIIIIIIHITYMYFTAVQLFLTAVGVNSPNTA